MSGSDSPSGPSERRRLRPLVRCLFGIELRRRAGPTLEFIRPRSSWEDREFAVRSVIIVLLLDP